MLLHPQLFVLVFPRQRLQEVVHAKDFGHDRKILRGVLQRLLVNFVQLPAVVRLVHLLGLRIREDVRLLAEIVHKLQLDVFLL